MVRRAEKAAAVLGPSALARLVTWNGGRDRVAALELDRERIPRGPRGGRLGRPASFPAYLKGAYRERQHGKADRAGAHPARDVVRAHGISCETW